jgi:hypothetical protein
MRRVSSVVVEGTVMGAFTPSGRQTTPEMSNANIEYSQLYLGFLIRPLTTF